MPDRAPASCVLNMGDHGAYLAVDQVRPRRNAVAAVSEGRRWVVTKRALEHTYLWHPKSGWRMPTALRVVAP